MALHIHKATMADLSRCAAIESACFPPERAASEASIRGRIETYPQHVLLGEWDGDVVGFIMGAVIDQPYIDDEMFADPSCHREDGPYQAVFSLAVIPTVQRRGFGGQLIHAMIAQARQEGRKGITLTCVAEKIRYYESFGFKNHGVSASSHGGAVWYNMVMEL